MWRGRSTVVRSILIALGLSLAGSLAVVSAAELRPGFHDRLSAAQARWDARSFAQYRIVLEDDSGRCRQDALITNEQVVRRLINTCRIPPRSVTSLFRLLDGTPPSRYRCVEHGCACDTVMSVATDYDPALGYPHMIHFVWQVRTNWYHRDYWGYLLANGVLPSCRPTTFSRLIKVLALTPLAP